MYGLNRTRIEYLTNSFKSSSSWCGYQDTKNYPKTDKFSKFDITFLISCIMYNSLASNHIKAIAQTDKSKSNND